jgi:hypothetical protein
VLAATGYGHYELARSIGVAVVIALVTGLITWVVAVFALASAMSGSTIGPVMGVLVLCAPALSVIILGLLALRFVPVHPPGVDRQFERAGSG